MAISVFGNASAKRQAGARPDFLDAKRSAPGAIIDVPMAYQDALCVKFHYDGMTLTRHDAPRRNEIADIAAYATPDWPNHLIGGLAAEEIKCIDGPI